MILITGAGGFIAGNLIHSLNLLGRKDLVLVDDFSKATKTEAIKSYAYTELVNRNTLFDWINRNKYSFEIVFHLGARTDTTENNTNLLNELNTQYTQKIWQWCTEQKIPLIYASSAATYGNGEHSYLDSEEEIGKLQPLNAYGMSKHIFDVWALQQSQQPPFWYGLKFFNVYGPGEHNKGRMASVIYHAYFQIQKTGQLKLFKSHVPKYKDGEQNRDFIYVQDIVDICLYLWKNKPKSGIYNAGTGIARTFKDLALSVFKYMQIHPNIEYINIPEDIRNKYQYYTCAHMEKLIKSGYTKEFTTLEEGVKQYIQYLSQNP